MRSSVMREVTRSEEMKRVRKALRWAPWVSAMKNPFFTIGHSTRTVSEFVDLLRPQEVKLVVDVRTVPRSRTNPQFN
jgi:hypothetical protein